MLSKLEPNKERELQDLLPDKVGFLWLRTEFKLPQVLKNKNLGLNLGRIYSAAEVFVNGKSVGSVGRFPPNSFEAGTAVNVFEIDSDWLKQDGTNVIIVKLWAEGRGSISPTAFLGELSKVKTTAKIQTFWLSTINIVFLGIMLVVSIFYLMLHFFRRNEKEYLDFGFANFFTALFLIPFCSLELASSGLFSISHLTLHKIFVEISSLSCVYFTSSFMINFLKLKQDRTTKIVRVFVLLLPCFFVLAQQDYSSLLYSLPILIVFIVAQLSFGILSLVNELLKGSKDALKLFYCYLPVVITVGVDAIVHFIFRLSTQPYYTIFGWQVSNICFLGLFVHRYATTFFEHERLKTYLEEEVKHRTNQLEIANRQLQVEQSRFKSDLDMAIQVQKNCLPNNNMFLEGWETAVFNSSISGLSADLYDYYFNGNKLCGCSLFEVSGEGLSAGLVTMIAKNIVAREFIYGERNVMKLTNIMKSISDSLMEEKGSVDNFFTGLLLKVGDSFGHSLCHCEAVSVGMPLPILYNSKDKECINFNAEVEDHNFGMLGVNGVEPNIASVHFDLENLDTIVCFSDGLMQFSDKQGLKYSDIRIVEILKEIGDKSSQEILQAIEKDMQTFADVASKKDDITILVLRRNKDLEYIPEL